MFSEDCAHIVQYAHILCMYIGLYRVFIDADKRSYTSYLEELLGERNSTGQLDGDWNLLNPGGLILVDNTLWKGLVLQEVGSIT